MKGRKLTMLAVISVMAAAFVSCEERIETPDGGRASEKVFIIYSCGHNNLSHYLLDDIQDICRTSPYCDFDSFYKVVVFSHRAVGTDFSKPVDPVLMQVYRGRKGEVVTDTLRVFPSKTYDSYGRPSEEGYTGSDPKTLNEVLAYIKENFPAKEYGFLFSSHGTGWLPYNYYNTGDPVTVTKSAGADYSGNYAIGVPAEMDVKDFAKAFRDQGIHMKYMLMDACFMGGIEVAYECRDICDLIMFSPTEISAQGFMYTSMLSDIWGKDEPDIVKMCQAYMGQYGQATITLADCRELDSLAKACKSLFERYRAKIAAVKEKEVQGFFRRSFNSEDEKHWFYDLRDILCKAGISEEELSGDFDKAMEKCVLYTGHSKTLFDGRECKAYCGFSMYLPCAGSTFLDNYYKEYQWNKETALVK